MNETSTPTAGHYIGNITLIAVGQVLFSVDFCTVSVALATIAMDLQVRPNILPWVVSTYSLTYAGFLCARRARRGYVRPPPLLHLRPLLVWCRLADQEGDRFFETNAQASRLRNKFL